MPTRAGDNMEKTVIGVFKSRGQVEKALRELRDSGFDETEVSVLAREDKGRGDDGGATTMGVGDDELSEGVATGGVLGGLAGLLAGVGALAIPGIGPIIAAGPIAGALTGAVTGGVAGGLIDWGIPEERGRHYESRLREGHILALIRADERRVDRAARILRENGAQEVETHDADRR